MTGGVAALAFAPHGGSLAVGTMSGKLTLLDPRRGTVAQRMSGGLDGVSAITISADGRSMATLSVAAGVQLWTLRGGRVVGKPRLYLPLYGVRGVSLSADGRRLAMASEVGIEVIDTATLARPVRLSGSQTVNYLVQFSPDGRFIVGGSEHGWVRVWSAATFKPATRALRGGAAATQGVSISPDGRTLASGSSDGVVRLFDLRDQQPFGAPLPAVPSHPSTRCSRPTARTCWP